MKVRILANFTAMIFFVSVLLLSPLVVGHSKDGHQRNTLPPSKFHGWIVDPREGDTVRVLYMKNVVSTVPGKMGTGYLDFYVKTDPSGQFSFDIPTTKERGRLYLNIIRHENGQRNSLVDDVVEYVVEPGDQIEMIITCQNAEKTFSADFSGPGSAKYTCTAKASHKIFRTSDLVSDYSSKYTPIGYVSPAFKEIFINRYQASVKELDSMRNQITNTAYYTLKADFYGYIFQNLTSNYFVLWERSFLYSQNYKIPDSIKKILPLYLDTLKIPFFDDFSKPTAKKYVLSGMLTTYLIWKEIYRLRRQSADGKINFPDLYTALNGQSFTPVLRDKVMGELFANPTVMAHVNLNQRAYDSVFILATKTIQTPYIKKFLLRSHRATRGAKAFDFAFTDSTGKLIHLSDFRGKVILTDTWFTGCAGCASFHRHFEDSVYPVLKTDTNFIVISICSDKNRNQWISSMRKGTYTSDHYINVFTNGQGEDNPMNAYYYENVAPFILLIDKGGNVFSRLYDVNSNDEVAGEIRQALNKN